MKNKNKAPIKNAPNQPLILRHITQMDSDRKQDAVKLYSEIKLPCNRTVFDDDPSHHFQYSYFESEIT